MKKPLEIDGSMFGVENVKVFVLDNDQQIIGINYFLLS